MNYYLLNLFDRASIEYNTNLVEVDLQRKTICYYYALKSIDQVLIALQFLQVVAYCKLSAIQLV